MKTALPWVLSAVLLGGVYFLYSTGSQRDAELDRLHQQNRDYDALRAENDRLKQAAGSNAELDRLRKENEEIPHLRGEVGRLRAENKQLTTDLQKAQTQRGQTQNQRQQQLTELATENQNLKAQNQQAQAQARTAICINNLRRIDAAKKQWAQEKGQGPNAFPSLIDLAPYLINHTLPVCPAGGAYSIGSMSAPPTCSIPEHVLPNIE